MLAVARSERRAHAARAAGEAGSWGAGRRARGSPLRRVCSGARRELQLPDLSASATGPLASREVVALPEERGGSEGGSEVRAPRTSVRLPGWDSRGVGSLSLSRKGLCEPGPERCQAQRPLRFTWTLCNWCRRPGVRGRCRPSASPRPLAPRTPKPGDPSPPRSAPPGWVPRDPETPRFSELRGRT